MMSQPVFFFDFGDLGRRKPIAERVAEMVAYLDDFRVYTVTLDPPIGCSAEHHAEWAAMFTKALDARKTWRGTPAYQHRLDEAGRLVVKRAGL